MSTNPAARDAEDSTLHHKDVSFDYRYRAPTKEDEVLRIVSDTLFH